MCSGAIYWAGIGRVVYGCPAEVLGSISGEELAVGCREVLGSGVLRAVEVVGPVLGEEAAASDPDATATLLREPCLFVVDPLDGTSNFLHGIPHYCVSIALVENGEPIEAVIYDPIKNELFTASKGKGAQLNDRKIRLTDRKDLSSAMVITGTPPRDRGRIGPHLDFCKALLSTAEDIRRTGSAALDLAYVACGRSDAYFESGIKAWDVAGGILLVREAGGRVSDFKGHGERILDAGNIVAGNVRINPILQAAIAQSEYGKSF